MPGLIDVTFDPKEIAALSPVRIMPAVKRALRKAGATALRDMRSEASKRVRARKRIKASFVRAALRMRRPKGASLDGAEWALDVRGTPTSLTAYPHRQTAKGVSVEVNRGKRTLIRGAFLATMKSGHKGVWVREDKERLPIRELLGSRPVDALLHEGEADAVQARGLASYMATFDRVLPLELDKGKGA